MDVLIFQTKGSEVREEKRRGPVAVWSWLSMKPSNKQHCHYDHSSQGKEDRLEIGCFVYAGSVQWVCLMNLPVAASQNKNHGTWCDLSDSVLTNRSLVIRDPWLRNASLKNSVIRCGVLKCNTFWDLWSWGKGH